MDDRYTGMIRRLARLYLENARLTLAEKLTRLMSAIALVAAIGALSFIALVFITTGVSDLLQYWIEPIWADLIVAGGYVVLAVVVYLFRLPLILNPMARFVTRMLLDPKNNER